jgi:hypothetical protein
VTSGAVVQAAVMYAIIDTSVKKSNVFMLFELVNWPRSCSLRFLNVFGLFYFAGLIVVRDKVLLSSRRVQINTQQRQLEAEVQVCDDLLSIINHSSRLSVIEQNLH